MLIILMFVVSGFDLRSLFTSRELQASQRKAEASQREQQASQHMVVAKLRELLC